MEQVVRTTRPSPISNTCWATAARTRSASSSRPSPLRSRATSRNSSPPQRTMMSEVRLHGLEQVAQLAQHGVARGVAGGVVDGLEVVEVDHHEGEVEQVRR